jgi:hypothetical protein
MTTIDSGFWATGGNASYNVGVTAWGSLNPPLDYGMIGIGLSSGVFGHVEGELLPQRAAFTAKAGVLGGADNHAGTVGVSNWVGVFGQSGEVSIFGSATRCGVHGMSADAEGVIGISQNNNGVRGNSKGGTGVVGISDAGFGVSGSSSASVGVYGTTDVGLVPPAANVSVGVWGDSYFSTGVMGKCAYGPAPGVSGESNQGSGVEGHSNRGSGVSGGAGLWGPTVPGTENIAGVVGSSDRHVGVIGTSNLFGVYGYSGNADPTKPGAGVYGQADPAIPTNWAGVFNGKVQVTDDLVVPATVTAKFKNAIVPFPDGTQRVLHCMESPEHWFEDFGAAKLKGGRAVVRLDRDFAKVIRTPRYHVFLTPRGECRGLSVRRQSAKSFEVRELGGGRSNVALSYRIVGRRKDIRRDQRFARIDIKPLAFPAQRTPPRIPPKLKPLVEMRRPAAAKAARTRRPKKARADRELSTLLARFRKQVGATAARRRRRRGKRA